MNAWLISQFTALALFGVFVMGSAGTLNVYTVRKGDTLSEIAQEKCGGASLYRTIKEANRLKGDTIYTGKDIVIPCMKTEEPALQQAEVPASTVITEIKPSDFKFSLLPTEEVPESTEPVVREEAPVSEPVAEIEPVRSYERVTVWPENYTLREGLYAVTIDGSSEYGSQPAVVNVRQDKNGFWEQEHIVASLNPTAGGDTQIVIQLRDNTKFSAESSIVIERGGGKAIQLTREDILPEHRVRSTKGLKKAELGDEKYAKLMEIYPEKPSKKPAVLNALLSIGVPAVLQQYWVAGIASFNVIKNHKAQQAFNK